MINLLNRNEKFVTVYNKCWKIPLSTLVRVRRSRELITTFIYVASSIQNANEKFVSFMYLSFVNCDLHLSNFSVSPCISIHCV
jgi:hypothetical protein